jgi:hypothetical protein
MEEIIGLAGGGVALVFLIRSGPRSLIALLAAAMAFRKDPRVHNRLRGLVRDLGVSGSAQADPAPSQTGEGGDPEL